MRSWAALAAGSLVLLAGCDGSHTASPSHAPATTVTATVPAITVTATIPAPATKMPTSFADGLADCSTQTLSVNKGGRQGGGGNFFTFFTVTSSSLCALQGYFGAAGYDSNGRVIFQHVIRDPGSEPRIAMTVSTTATFTLRTSISSRGGSSSTCPVVATLHLTPPNQRTYLNVGGLHLTVCEPTNGGASMTSVTAKP